MASTTSKSSAIFLILLCIGCPVLAVTVFPSDTAPLAYNDDGIHQSLDSVQGLFRHSCSEEYHSNSNATVHFSSFQNDFSQEQSSNEDMGQIYPTSDGFIRGSIDAWAQHQHLVLRPDEVWFEILAQLNFYMNANAEAVRHIFVAHEGKQTIVVEHNTVEDALVSFKDAIQERIKTEWLRDWMLPGFSTSTEDDDTTATVLMMGLMQQYFDYAISIICGLPSVTLLGQKSDWEALLAKLDRLIKFGKEPNAYASQLRPILTRFVRTFDEPDSHDTRAFWNRIVHAEAPETDLCGGSPFYLSGWLPGFLFWDAEGQPLYKSSSSYKGKTDQPLTLDRVEYGTLGINDLPVGYAQAPVTLLDFQGVQEFPAYVLAGNIAKRVKRGLPDGYDSELKRFNGSEVNLQYPHGTLEPLSGWMLYGPAGGGKVEWEEELGMLSTSLRRSWGTSQCPGTFPKRPQFAYDELSGEIFEITAPDEL